MCVFVCVYFVSVRMCGCMHLSVCLRVCITFIRLARPLNTLRLYYTFWHALSKLSIPINFLKHELASIERNIG